MAQPVIIGPSILSADFLRLGEQLTELEAAGADYIHFDVMDGAFVPNISVGLPVLEATQRGTSLPMDVHLMIVNPDAWVEAFADAGADSVTFHIEATPHAHRVAQTIRAKGKGVGIAINPSTPLAAVAEMLPFVDQVLVMTINPGFGGQTLINEMLGKITRMREMMDRINPSCRLQVDGGVNDQTIGKVVAAGACSIVAGSYTFNPSRTIAESIAALRAGYQ
ncbi:MAG: ribulose-phosphate 3-epimerase [Thermomicrobiales bacterium]|nr:ribulose-phosphate 3-epimerase [Thermomicrobiales bacterium]